MNSGLFSFRSTLGGRIIPTENNTGGIPMKILVIEDEVLLAIPSKRFLKIKDLM